MPFWASLDIGSGQHMNSFNILQLQYDTSPASYRRETFIPLQACLKSFLKISCSWQDLLCIFSALFSMQKSNWYFQSKQFTSKKTSKKEKANTNLLWGCVTQGFFSSCHLESLCSAVIKQDCLHFEELHREIIMKNNISVTLLGRKRFFLHSHFLLSWPSFYLTT